MGILLLLLGVLAALGGGVKLRRATPSRALAAAELWGGSATVLASGIGLARVRPLAWLVVGGLVALVALSSVRHLRAALAARSARAASEGRRLEAYLGGPHARS